MRKILIVGAGQSGLQLGLSLLAEGYDVTIMSARTPGEIRGGRPTSTQVMFEPALATERGYGLNPWEEQTPAIAGLRLSLSAPPGNLALGFSAPLDHPARSVDQRVKLAAWLEMAEERGATVQYGPVALQDLDTLTQGDRYDLTVVAAGRNDLVGAFAPDPERSPYSSPQRALAVAYVHGLDRDPGWSEPHVGFNAVPGLGELFVIPALTLSGPCDILFWEAVPGGPLDRWPNGAAPMPAAEHLSLTLELARQYVPWVHERCANVELTDAGATLHGRYAPTVRKAVAHLPGGGTALGMGDVVIANDPVTGQGANTAAKCADHYRRAILARADRPFDAAWQADTFASFWTAHGAAVTGWTNAMLQPLPEHVQQVLGVAAGNPVVARRFANGFADPNDFLTWFTTPEQVAAYLGSFAPA